jgi:hypothetical protein
MHRMSAGRRCLPGQRCRIPRASCRRVRYPRLAVVAARQAWVAGRSLSLGRAAGRPVAHRAGAEQRRRSGNRSIRRLLPRPPRRRHRRRQAPPIANPQNPGARRPGPRYRTPPRDCRDNQHHQHHQRRDPRRPQRQRTPRRRRCRQPIHRRHHRRRQPLQPGVRRIHIMGVRMNRLRILYRQPLRTTSRAANLAARVQARRWHFVFGRTARASDSHENPLWECTDTVGWRRRQHKALSPLPGIENFAALRQMTTAAQVE